MNKWLGLEWSFVNRCLLENLGHIESYLIVHVFYVLTTPVFCQFFVSSLCRLWF